MSARVTVVGSANTDLVCQVERLPAPGETVIGGRFFEAAGGKGANQAVAAARLGAQVRLVARVGQDAFGDRAVAGYEREGLEARFIGREPAAASGVALILVDAAGENEIAVASGANALLTAELVEAAAAAFDEAEVVLVQLEVPLEAVAAAVRLGRRAGATVILNPAPAPDQPLPAELLSQVHVLVPNETEAARLTGLAPEATEEELADALRGLGVEIVVLTRGARGALLIERERAVAIEAPRVEAVDATAAGDAFCGALSVALAEDLALRTAAVRACAAGALAATRPGAQPSLPTREELDRFVDR